MRRDLHLDPGLRILLAACRNLLKLSLHIIDDLVHVQLPAVVHLHHNGRVLQVILQLTDLLQRKRGDVKSSD